MSTRFPVTLILSILCALTLAPTGQAESQTPSTVESLAWMSGCWGETAPTSSSSPSRQTLECWTDPRGGLLLGLHRDIGRRTSFEYLRIEDRENGPVYLASPGGREPTAFRLTDGSETSAVFSNPDHDFPKRIVYRLQADGRLYVTAEGDIGGETRKLEWTWSRVDFPGSQLSH